MPSGRSHMTGRSDREPQGDARRKVDRPRSRNQWPRSPPRGAFAPSVAFGLGVRMLAAGPAHLPTVLLFERLCERRANLTQTAR
jgi:hypothetical protein